MLLRSIIIRTAREIYTQLTVEGSFNYDTVKELKLMSWSLRLTGRNVGTDGQTHVEFARTKEQLFDRWAL